MKPKVSVIVLNWNGIHFTTECIKSLKKQTFKDFEIIVVDNGSTKDNSVEILEKTKGIKLVKNKTNLGFAEGNNVGARHANASTYVALLNNDTQVDKDWLKELVKAMDEYPQLGEAMSKVYNKYSEKEFTESSYGTSTLMLFLTKYSFPVSEKGPIPVFSSSGGAMIYRKELRDVPFDGDYFIYNEDGWLGWLLRLRGFKVATIPSSKVYHEGEATIKANKSMSGYFKYLGERNRVLNLLLFYSKFNLLRLLPIFILSTLFINIYNVGGLQSRLRAYCWLIFHIPTVIRKRNAVQKQRKVGDSNITQYLSAKLFEPSNFGNPLLQGMAGVLNKLTITYCRILRIPTIETKRPDFTSP